MEKGEGAEAPPPVLRAGEAGASPGHARHLSQGKISETRCPLARNGSKEFRTLAWEAANERAGELGWIRSCGELHEAVKRTGSAA